MNFEIKGIHYEVSQRTVEQFEKKIKRLDFASELLSKLTISVEREKSQYNLSADFSFTWGSGGHIMLSNHDLYKGIDLIVDKLENKISKEKEKIQSH